MIERVGFVAAHYLAVQSVHRHVHQTQLRVIFHLFLTVERHLRVGVHARLADEVARLHEHAARTTGGVEHYALLGFQHVDEHLHQRLGCEEHAVVACHSLGKL